MPVYLLKCQNGHYFDRFLKLAEYDTPQTCECGASAERQITAPHIAPDYAGYDCPVTGKWIEGRRQHQENLKQTGCRLREPGETEQSIKRREKEEADFDRRVENTVEAEISKMPVRKRERLAAELESGVDAQIIRN